MKVILIEEERFAEVMQLLRAECLAMRDNGYLQQQTSLTPQQIQFAADEMFRCFNYHFVRWAQSHGASCVQR